MLNYTFISGLIAQRIEHPPSKRVVVGSNPTRSIFFFQQERLAFLTLFFSYAAPPLWARTSRLLIFKLSFPLFSCCDIF
ncbi:MAG: hypothetical protein K0S07_809 [Chlamydiales bacterium]|nr:hypothetical protein [Chlamydiales bacterium]